MKIFRALALSLLVLTVAGVAQAQDTPRPPESEAAPQAVCLIDDHLSLWLSLESADRMVAALEKERRELSEQLAKHRTTLKLMDDGKVVSGGFTMTQIGVLRTTESGGREVLRETCGRVEARLTEVNKTLKRRRMRRDRLEEWLDLLLGTGTADGS